MATVLVADDLPEVRQRIRMSLEDLAEQIIEVPDGAEALAVLAQTTVAIVISDVRMPRLDGLALVRALGTDGPPVILHSGYDDVAAALEGLRLGALDFLPAPLDLSRLRQLVDRSLRNQDYGETEFVGDSAAAAEMRRLIHRMADAPDPVLITGETGVGKEVVAREIHRVSHRRNGPFVAVNLCAFAEGTLESELFGHERGAFTGATARRRGCFERAEGGSILLDEIGDAPARVQTELLRVIETGCFERVGGERALAPDVRILAATHQDLPAAVALGRFREDLWYRLSTFRFEVPPLRERPTDVDSITDWELECLSHELRGLPFELDESGRKLLRRHAWPGNVRELRSTLRRMATLAGERRLLGPRDVERSLDLASPVPLRRRDGIPTSQSGFDGSERAEILSLLHANRWNVSATARDLGIGRGALRARMRRLGLDGSTRRRW